MSLKYQQRLRHCPCRPPHPCAPCNHCLDKQLIYKKRSREGETWDGTKKTSDTCSIAHASSWITLHPRACSSACMLRWGGMVSKDATAAHAYHKQTQPDCFPPTLPPHHLPTSLVTETNRIKQSSPPQARQSCSTPRLPSMPVLTLSCLLRQATLLTQKVIPILMPAFTVSPVVTIITIAVIHHYNRSSSSSSPPLPSPPLSPSSPPLPPTPSSMSWMRRLAWSKIFVFHGSSRQMESYSARWVANMPSSPFCRASNKPCNRLASRDPPNCMSTSWYSSNFRSISEGLA
mmetsp:Transcript_2731/g.6316  ORF Transcript_2731/g.6316 Transcript_2731/m.6316 type:complete len:289 (+) Transcript_2731:908-1774(+)